MHNEQRTDDYIRNIDMYMYDTHGDGIICIQRGAGHSLIILSLGQRRDLVMPLGRSLWFLPYAYVYRIFV